MTYKGKVYGVCVGSVVYSGIYYNKDIFAEYDLELPETYDELIAVCETLKDNGVTPFTTAGAPIWPVNMMIHGFTGPLFSDLMAFEKELWTGGPGWANPTYVEALTKYQRLLANYYEPGFQALDYNPHIGRFIAGQAAMLPDGSWQAASITDAGGPDFNFGYMPIPASDNAADNKKFWGKYDLMWQVHAKSENKDAAMKWLEFFSRKENYTLFINKVGWIPTQPDIEVSNEVVAEIAQLPTALAFEQIHVSRTGQGQYADGLPGHLVPVGTVETVGEFVELAKNDWDAAAAQ
jgi:raffinose/stachyose/melibiose transport system substrate-binding protein